MSTHIIDLQNNCSFSELPKFDAFRCYANAALSETSSPCELTIRLVNPDEIKALNSDFRKKDKPTNVLAFPSHLPAEIELPIRFLGDVIICPSIVKEESIAQKKPFDDHLAHIVIHGILHLLGYDHIKEQDAKIMEPLEIKLLSTLDIANPYEEIDHD